MPLLRISTGVFVFMWGIDKVVATAGAGRIFGHFYHLAVGPAAVRAAAAFELLLAVCLAVGFQRRAVAWTTLAMTLASTLGSWKEILDPWGFLGLTTGGTHLFLASIPLTAVAVVLVLNVDDDTLTVDGRLARRR
ncbi:MAG: DoxX family membrane protein [Gemmatimonadota bacterium]|nr:DoxX family membrane protein [Gemmatimonadota bacterium]MDE3126415.1 DoxX family membrane protein [Gemmatimonadota bacterium]